ncbi:thermonuclease family protein [Roseibium aggregatum]|uniref:thermonuclease family protein n=1 Tax=Roseibium aggregatum TaxID=187304 RepID=UPI003A7F2EA4|nr:hypothetical protein GFK90_25235 [Roseibium aggregatum]
MLRATLVAALCLISTFASAEEWSSAVSKVYDGDTFWLSRPLIKIRLCGVDTPEKGKPGDKQATQFLKTLVAGKKVRCRTVGDGTPCDGRSPKKSGNRFVAQCFVDGTDIAMALVNAGHACAWPRFSGRYYSTVAKCVR